eukprot:TRINITY_DN10154_c0_g1_i1.p1 TRINITY_DN10154_c0_g1~~TRINITY_DN10154_c0_g1_i1.p1  ORF type:complete len:221 (-),score=43.15 TRINITY_DN10154_c0_g1_i1:79-708(-)
MASTALQLFPHTKPSLSFKNQTPSNPSKIPLQIHQTHKKPIGILPKCTSNPQQEQQQPQAAFELQKPPKKSTIDRQKGPLTSLEKPPEPPNFEIGWKRTKEIHQEQPKGYVIADFLEKLEGLLGREYGSKDLLAKAGGIVAERAREEAEVLREGGEVDERLVTELFRVLRLMEMDLEMVKAAVKEETLQERIQQAISRCRQAILVANSF